MTRLRRWFAQARFTRRDAAMYTAIAVGAVMAVVGRMPGWHWLYPVAYVIDAVLIAVCLWFGVRLVALLIRRRRERQARDIGCEGDDRGASA